jgi:hypothetical protein
MEYALKMWLRPSGENCRISIATFGWAVPNHFLLSPSTESFTEDCGRPEHRAGGWDARAAGPSAGRPAPGMRELADGGGKQHGRRRGGRWQERVGSQMAAGRSAAGDMAGSSAAGGTAGSSGEQRGRPAGRHERRGQGGELSPPCSSPFVGPSDKNGYC